jgi:hypothetical protein
VYSWGSGDERRAGPGLAGALGRRGRGALKKSDPGGGAGRSKKVGVCRGKVRTLMNSLPSSRYHNH